MKYPLKSSFMHLSHVVLINVTAFCMAYRTHTLQSFREYKTLLPGLLLGTHFHDHITPVLHWLPVRYRIMYKILILTYKCIHGLAPLYLQELIQEYKPTLNLRSSSKLKLVSATVSTHTMYIWSPLIL